jgi:hypothetical protein
VLNDVNSNPDSIENLTCSVVNVSHDSFSAVLSLSSEIDYAVTVDSRTSEGYNEGLTLERMVLLGKACKVMSLKLLSQYYSNSKPKKEAMSIHPGDS